MKSSLEKLPKSRVRLSVEIPQNILQKGIDTAYDKLNQQIEVKGFRKGQAPKRMIFDAVGLERVRETILQEIIPETYYHSLQQEKLVPVEGPQVSLASTEWEKDLAEGKAAGSLSYRAEVDTLPTVTLKKDYKKLRIDRSNLPSEEVSDEEVNTVINHLRRREAQFKAIERVATKGDRVEIEFEGKVDGVAREEFTSKNYPVILGDGVFLPDFEKQLFGMKKQESKTFATNVPSKQDPEKQEKVEFTVKLLNVEEMILPAVDDEFARKVGQDSLLALRGAVRASLHQNKEERVRQAKEQQIADQLLEMTDIEVPASLIHQEVHRMIESLQRQAEQYRMPWESYLAQIKKTEHDLHHEFAAQAEKTVKFGLTLGFIMKEEKIDNKDTEAGKKTMARLVQYATRKS